MFRKFTIFVPPTLKLRAIKAINTGGEKAFTAAYKFCGEIPVSCLENRVWTHQKPRSEATMRDKLLTNGWAEHQWLFDAFTRANRVECYLSKGPEESIHVEVNFFQKGSVGRIFGITAYFDRTGDLAVCTISTAH